MNFGDLQDEVKLLLNFTTGGVDQDFTAQQIKDAINAAYRREVRRARQTGGRDWFKTTQDFVWDSGDVTKELPASLRGKALINMVDVTSTDPGYTMFWSDDGFTGDIMWKNRFTMQWGEQGPNQDTTLRATYYGEAETMVDDMEEPELIPNEHREVIVWSAGCFLRQVADETAPPAWISERKDCRLDLWKALALGRPSRSNESTVRHAKPSDTPEIVY